jgi:serine/threonine protein phosphatase PrpC
VQSLPFFIASNSNFGKDWALTLKEAFLSAQSDLESFCGEHQINIDASGAAGTVVVFDGTCFHFAHIGDAGAMLASYNRRDSCLLHGTKDHKPEIPEEKARLEEAGNDVRQVDPESWRIYLKDSNFPGLTMSRAFGDTACDGVLREPEYKQIFVQPADEVYLVVASDGIWEFIEKENAVDLSAKKLRLKGPKETVNFLISASRKRWAHVCGDYCDDITCMLVQFSVNEKTADASSTNQSLAVRRHE